MAGINDPSNAELDLFIDLVQKLLQDAKSCQKALRQKRNSPKIANKTDTRERGNNGNEILGDGQGPPESLLKSQRIFQMVQVPAATPIKGRARAATPPNDRRGSVKSSPLLPVDADLVQPASPANDSRESVTSSPVLPVFPDPVHPATPVKDRRGSVKSSTVLPFDADSEPKIPRYTGRSSLVTVRSITSDHWELESFSRMRLESVLSISDASPKGPSPLSSIPGSPMSGKNLLIFNNSSRSGKAMHASCEDESTRVVSHEGVHIISNEGPHIIYPQGSKSRKAIAETEGEICPERRSRTQSSMSASAHLLEERETESAPKIVPEEENKKISEVLRKTFSEKSRRFMQKVSQTIQAKARAKKSKAVSVIYVRPNTAQPQGNAATFNVEPRKEMLSAKSVSPISEVKMVKSMHKPTLHLETQHTELDSPNEDSTSQLLIHKNSSLNEEVPKIPIAVKHARTSSALGTSRKNVLPRFTSAKILAESATSFKIKQIHVAQVPSSPTELQHDIEKFFEESGDISEQVQMMDRYDDQLLHQKMWFVILHDNPIRQSLERIIAILAMTNVIIQSFVAGFLNYTTLSSGLHAILCIYDILFLFNFVIRFGFAYHCPITGKTIVKHKLMALHYLKTDFPMHLCAALPLTLAATPTPIPINAWLYSQRMPLLVSVLYYETGFQAVLQRMPLVSRFGKICLTYFLLLHLLACGYWYNCTATNFTTVMGQNYVNTQTILEMYAKATYTGFCLLSASSYDAQTSAETHFMIISIIVFFYISGVLTGSLTNLLTEHQAVSERNKQVDGLRTYLTGSHVPRQLKKSIMSYVKYKWDAGQTEYTSSLFDELPSKQKIMMHLHFQKTFIESTPLLRDLPTFEVVWFMRRLVPRIARAKEMIIKQGEEGHCMYFVQHGLVKVYLGENLSAASSGTLYLVTLGTGNQFGEIALCKGCRRTANCCALQFTELLELSQIDFECFCQAFKGVRNMLTTLSDIRLRVSQGIEASQLKLGGKLGLQRKKSITDDMRAAYKKYSVAVNSMSLDEGESIFSLSALKRAVFGGWKNRYQNALTANRGEGRFATNTGSELFIATTAVVESMSMSLIEHSKFEINRIAEQIPNLKN